MEKTERTHIYMRTHIYIGRCPDCEAIQTMISVVKGDDPAWVALEVGKAIMRGLVVEVMTDLDFCDKKPKLGGCHCKARKILARPSCAYCGEKIYRGDVLSESYLDGSIAIVHLHKECQKKMHDGDRHLFEEWGEGERPDSPEKEADRAAVEREAAIARGQLDLPL